MTQKKKKETFIATHLGNYPTVNLQCEHFLQSLQLRAHCKVAPAASDIRTLIMYFNIASNKRRCKEHLNFSPFQVKQVQA